MNYVKTYGTSDLNIVTDKQYKDYIAILNSYIILKINDVRKRVIAFGHHLYFWVF